MLTIKLVLDTRRKNDDGVYPVKIRVTWHRVQKYYLTEYKMNEGDFNQVQRSAPPRRLRDAKIILDAKMDKARVIARELPVFSFIGFEKRFLTDAKPTESLFGLFESVIKKKQAEGSFNTASNYQCSLNSLLTFNKKLSFADITPDMLWQFEAYLLKHGKQRTTVGIYMRPLRAIINEAIFRGYMHRDQYPFGKRQYVIPEGRNPKRAIDREEFQKVIQMEIEEERGFKARSRDFFVLSYLCQGMNFRDLLLLRKDQIEGEEIVFVRGKTKETGRTNPILIRVPLLEESIEIIEKWRDRDTANQLLFPFISERMDPELRHKAIMQFIKVTNKHLAYIREELEITSKVTTYTARHQFSKAILDGGESVEYLSECLGHKSIRTTQFYVQGFGVEKKRAVAKKLLISEKNTM